MGTAASLCREPAKASSDCGGFAHQAFLQPSGSVDCLSISSSQDPFRQESKGKRSHFDVSHEVGQGAGGEGPRGKACWGQSLLPSQASPGKTPACLVTPFISPLCGARSLPKPLGYSTLLVPNLCPAWGPRPSFHSVPWAGSHAVSGEHGGTAGHLGWELNPPTRFVVGSTGHVVITSGRKVREEHFPEYQGSQGREGLYL